MGVEEEERVANKTSLTILFWKYKIDYIALVEAFPDNVVYLLDNE